MSLASKSWYGSQKLKNLDGVFSGEEFPVTSIFYDVEASRYLLQEPNPFEACKFAQMFRMISKNSVLPH